MSNDYLIKKEIEYLNGLQRNIYNRVEKEMVLKKYRTLCVIEYVCPICGSDLSYNNFCNKCNSQFSITGKKIND